VCPAPLYPEDLETSMNWILFIAAPITLFLGVVVLGLQIYQKSWFLKFPRRYVPIHGIFLILDVIAQVIVIGKVPNYVLLNISHPLEYTESNSFLLKGGYEGIGCLSPGESVQGNTAAAIAQTWILYYGTWGAGFGFTIIATNVLLVRVVDNDWLQKRAIYFDIAYLSILLVPPTVILVVLQALLYVGYAYEKQYTVVFRSRDAYDSERYCSGIGSCFFITQIPLGAVRDVLDLFLLIIPFR